MRDHKLHQKMMEFFYFRAMHSISTLIFDLGGVIINLKSEQDWLEQDLLPNFNPESLRLLQRQRFFHEFETGKITPADFIRQLKSIALEENVSDETIIRHWNGILKDIPAHRIDLLRRLKDRHRLILLSNTNAIHMDAIRRYMQSAFGEDVLETSFHTCYYSQQIGLRKPGREIYEFVMQEQQLPAERCVFLDDKQENLTEPGKLGIRTILVDRDISELIAGQFF